MARIFFGLFPDRNDAERLAATAKGLADVRPVPIHQLHLTVRFVGSIPFDRSAVGVALQEKLASQPSIKLTFDNLDYFPSSQRPSVVALIGRPSESLQAFAAAVDITLRPYGLTEPTNSFRPHLTVARPERHSTHSLPVVQSTPVTFKEFRCVDSYLGSSGPTYTTLFSIRLHG